MHQGRITHLDYEPKEEEDLEPEEKEKIMELIKKNDPFEMRLKSISLDRSKDNKIKICQRLG